MCAYVFLHYASWTLVYTHVACITYILDTLNKNCMFVRELLSLIFV